MQVTETLNDGLKRGFALKIAGAAIEERVAKAIAEVAPRVRMPGFRPGKVPGNLIRKMHGSSLRQEAIKEAIDEGVKTLLTERALRPANQPSVDLDALPDDGSDLVVSVALEVLPEVPAADLEGIALERWTVEVDEAAVDQAVDRLADAQKSFADAGEGHAAAEGDLVVMDFRGIVDGEAFEGGTGEGMEIELGSGRLIPGFEDQLLGATAGEERVVKLTIPDDYPSAAIAGKDAEFAVKVSAVKVATRPAIDDALATNLGLDSLEALRDILKDQVERELSGLSRTYMKRKLLDHLAAAHDFAVPPSMVEAEFGQIWRQLTETADEAEKAKAEGEREDYMRIAERRVRLGLLLSDIGQKNGIQITASEMNRLIAEEAGRYPGQEAEVRKFFTENALAAAQLRAPLFEEKVVDFLIGKAAVTEKNVSRADLEAAIESEDETPLGSAAHGEAGHVHGPDCDHGHDHDHDHDHDAAPKPKKKAAAKKAGADDAGEALTKSKRKAAKTAE
jgi:trigger factor